MKITINGKPVESIDQLTWSECIEIAYGLIEQVPVLNDLSFTDKITAIRFLCGLSIAHNIIDQSVGLVAAPIDQKQVPIYKFFEKPHLTATPPPDVKRIEGFSVKRNT